MIVHNRATSQIDTFATYTDVHTGSARKIFVTGIQPINDTIAMLTLKNGAIATYSTGTGFRVLDMPKSVNPYQQVTDLGFLRDLVLLRSVAPTGNPREVDRWTLVNVRTGKVDHYAYPGSAYSLTLFWNSPTIDEGQRVMPLSESTWVASFYYGELMITKDAGKTWGLVKDIPRDSVWGDAWIGINRVYDRGGGDVAILTERQRLMMRDSFTKEWYISHLGPFTHAIELPSGSRAAFTKTNMFYADDYNSQYRLRYGPSTMYFPQRDTVWTSGDVVTSMTMHGDFIDTILPRRVRLIKKISPDVIVAAMDSVYFSFFGNNEWVYVSKDWPIIVRGTDTIRAALGDIVVAENGNFIAGLRGARILDVDGELSDSLPGGIILSEDKGNTWQRSSTGIADNLYVSSFARLPTGTLICIATEVRVDPTRYDRLFGFFRVEISSLGAKEFKIDFAYIFRSTDHGYTWQRVHVFPDRDLLPNVDPKLMVMPNRGILAIHPGVGFASTTDDGRTWVEGDELTIGNALVNDVLFTDDGYMHLATDQGYTKVRAEMYVNVAEQPHIAAGIQSYVTKDGRLMFKVGDIITEVTLYSVTGMLVAHELNQSGIEYVDVSNMSRGTYIVQCRIGTELHHGLVAL